MGDDVQPSGSAGEQSQGLAAAGSARIMVPNEPHALLAHTLSLSEKSAVKRLQGGLSLPLKSLRFLREHPVLWPSVVVPTAINVGMFTLTVGAVLYHSGDLMGWLWARPEVAAWYHALLLGLWWVVRLLATALMLVLSYFFVIIVGGVIASPFTDTLSQRTETILLGDVPAVQGGAKAMVLSSARGVGAQAFTSACYLVLMVPILALNLMPGIGSVISTLLGAGLSSFFLAMEYTNSPFERRAYSYRTKVATIWEYRGMTWAFGFGTVLLLWIPVVNFFCIPIAVIGGTAMGVALDEWRYKAQGTAAAEDR